MGIINVSTKQQMALQRKHNIVRGWSYISIFTIWQIVCAFKGILFLDQLLLHFHILIGGITDASVPELAFQTMPNVYSKLKQETHSLL